MANDLEFRVYNRFGQLVFETKDWSRKWDGTIGGQRQARRDLCMDTPVYGRFRQENFHQGNFCAGEIIEACVYQFLLIQLYFRIAPDPPDLENLSRL